MIHIAIFLFTFMTAIDITVSATIMPQVISALGDMQLYPLMSSAYLMAFFITAPIFGKVSDHFGCKKAAFVAIALFLLGSLGCGASSSMKELIFARFLQGIGACGLVNICSILIGRLRKQDHERSFMQAILSAIWALASIVGPLIGAYLTVHFSWRAVFFLNLPLGVIASLTLYSFEEVHTQIAERFDKKSVILFCFGSLFLFLACMKASIPLPVLTLFGVSAYKLVLGVLGALFAAAFIKRSLNIASPLIPVQLLREPHIAVCIIFGIVSGVCITTSHTLISLYIQGALRQSIQAAGGVIMASAIGWAVGSFACSYLLRKIDLRTVCLVAILALTSGFSLIAFGGPQNNLRYFVVCNFILGFGLGSMVNVTITGVQKIATAKFLGRATSFLSLMRSLGTTTGAALAGLLQLFYFRSNVESFAGHGISPSVADTLASAPEKFLNGSIAAAIEPSEFRFLCELFGTSIQDVFVFPIGMLLLIAPLAFFFSKEKQAAEVSAYRS